MSITLTSEGRNFKKLQLSAVAANGANASDSVAVNDTLQSDWQFLWASHSDTSTFALQTSSDGGTNWDTISGTSKTTSGASGSTGLTIGTTPGGLIRLLVTETDANANSTITTNVTLKKGR